MQKKYYPLVAFYLCLEIISTKSRVHSCQGNVEPTLVLTMESLLKIKNRPSLRKLYRLQVSNGSRLTEFTDLMKILIRDLSLEQSNAMLNRTNKILKEFCDLQLKKFNTNSLVTRILKRRAKVLNWTMQLLIFPNLCKALETLSVSETCLFSNNINVSAT
jgi:hypothetical protein